MNRVNRPEVEPLPTLRLYREDLEKLFAIFKENCQQVVLADDEYAYESVEEMAKNTATCSALHLSGIVPHAELLVKGARASRLRVQRSTLWIMGPNDKSRLVFLEAKNLLLSRRWRFKEIVTIAMMALGLAAMLASSFLRAILRGHLTHGELEAELIGLLGLFIFLIGAFIYNERVSQISLQRRVETQSFLKRNQDKILLTFVGAAIGAAFTLLINWLTK